MELSNRVEVLAMVIGAMKMLAAHFRNNSPQTRHLILNKYKSVDYRAMELSNRVWVLAMVIGAMKMLPAHFRNNSLQTHHLILNKYKSVDQYGDT